MVEGEMDLDEELLEYSMDTFEGQQISVNIGRKGHKANHYECSATEYSAGHNETIELGKKVDKGSHKGEDTEYGTIIDEEGTRYKPVGCNQAIRSDGGKSEEPEVMHQLICFQQSTQPFNQSAKEQYIQGIV